MVAIASKSQLRMSLVRWALFTVPLIVLLGWLSGQLSGSGYGNAWFDSLQKPEAMPPGWAFGLIWITLYALMGFALAMVLAARGAPMRGAAIAAFVVQLLLNLAWSPLFFAMHQVSAALWLIIAMFVAVLVTTWLFGRVRSFAAWLLVPYLAWLTIATALNWQIDTLNPDAETLAPAAASAQISG